MNIVDTRKFLKDKESDGYIHLNRHYFPKALIFYTFHRGLFIREMVRIFLYGKSIFAEMSKLVIKVKKPYEWDYYLEQLAFSIQ